MSKQIDGMIENVWTVMENHFSNTDEQKDFLEELVIELKDIIEEFHNENEINKDDEI